jgi:hydrogenase maturation protein HypF
MHPRYVSSGDGVRVQHHHAHIASVMAENGLLPGERVIGVAFDGTGYGPDGTIWGGEVLLATYDGYERLAHLAPWALPAGDAEIARVGRLALAYLWSVGLPWPDRLIDARPDLLRRRLERGVNIARTSSMGRLFDVVATLVSVRQAVTYEGQAAVELEALAAPDVREAYRFAWACGEILSRPVVEAVLRDLDAGVPPMIIAAKFHNAVAGLIVGLAVDLAGETGVRTVGLSGGVFQNVTLLEAVAPRLRDAGLRVLLHRQVPPNDGGLSLGQAVIAGRMQPCV